MMVPIKTSVSPMGRVNERFSGVQRCRNKCCLTRDGNAHGVSLVQGTSGKKDKSMRLSLGTVIEDPATGLD